MSSASNRHLIVDSEKCEALCTCGNSHPVPSVQLVSSENAYSLLAQDCSRVFSKKPVLILDDENTHQAAGKTVQESIKKRSIACKLVTLPGDAVATDMLAEQVCDFSAGQSLVVAVGAGTISDLGKYVSGKLGIPCWSVPTAPSMNGYTSSIMAIKVNGVKRTLPAPPPQYIYADPRVIQKSPANLRQAGFCDVLAKSVSDYDWQTESLLFRGSYCSLPSAIAAEAEGKYIDGAEKIFQGDRDAVLGLFEGLLFSGVAMSLAGSSAPASGGEHLISHFLDMREYITGRKPNLHGLQVGTGMVLSATCYRKLAALEEKELKNRARDSFEADAGRISSVWGSLASEVEKQFFGKRDRLMQFDLKLPENWRKLKGLFTRVRTPDFFVELFRRAGLDMTLASLGIPEEEFFLGATCARTIRDRITVLDISAHTGILEDAAKETIKMLS